jgi:hypothetical protein
MSACPFDDRKCMEMLMLTKIVLFTGVLGTAPLLKGAVITSGFVQFANEYPSVFAFTTAGPVFTAEGQFGSSSTAWPGNACRPCGPGQVIDASAFASGGDLAGPGSVFRFTAPEVVAAGPGHVFTSFSFTGSFCKGARDDLYCYDEIPLTGRGNVAITFVENSFDPETQVLWMTDVTYTFVIPEPSSFWLVACFCAVFLVCSVRRKRGLTQGPPKY